MSRISWKQINKAVEAIEAGGTAEGVFRSAVEQLARLVPFAHGVATPNMNLKEIRQRVGRPNERMITHNAPPGYWESYLRYYEALDPNQTEEHYLAHSGVAVVDRSCSYETEFGHDFLKPYGVRYILCLNNLSLGDGRGFCIGLYRDRTPFSEKDVDAASALFPHIHNLSLMAADRGELRAAKALSAAAAAGLSAREQEVAVLLAQRMSIREIADRLFISRHTVEKHMQHIYWKLNAGGKSDVRRQLLGEMAD